MKRNLEMIKKETEIFGLLFLGDGVTISRCPLLNILASENNITVAVLEIVDCQGHIADGNKKIGLISGNYTRMAGYFIGMHRDLRMQ